jgi:prevent-host-death family protein
MEDVDLRHAKEHLEELIERARRGEDVRISDPAGEAVRLVPTSGPEARPSRIKFGQWKHLAEIPEAELLAPLGCKIA